MTVDYLDPSLNDDMAIWPPGGRSAGHLLIAQRVNSIPNVAEIDIAETLR